MIKWISHNRIIDSAAQVEEFIKLWLMIREVELNPMIRTKFNGVGQEAESTWQSRHTRRYVLVCMEKNNFQLIWKAQSKNKVRLDG